MADEIPDWVLLEAARRASFSKLYAVDELRLLAKGDGSFPALCDMIAKHERPPVDEATEMLAQIYETIGLPESAKSLRAGGRNHLKAIDLLRAYLAKVRAEAKA